MDKTYKIVRGDLETSFRVRDLQFNTIEFTIKKYMEDDDGKVIINTGYTVFFSNEDFIAFFTPFVNDLNERIKHANSKG